MIMKPIFSREISVYRNSYDSLGEITTLGNFLFSHSEADKVMAIRNETDEEKQKSLKLMLPQAAICGVFSQKGAAYIVEYSHLICVDIDAKDNQGVDMEYLKGELSVIPQIAYIGLSVRGKGLFCIIPIKYPQNTKQQFQRLEMDFLKMGVVIDHNCSDLCRLRCASYDPHPYVNKDAVEYDRYHVEPKEEPKFHTHHYDNDDTLGRVWELCGKVEARHTDVFGGDYDKWYKVGMSLASLGESGREPFHILSRQDLTKYNRKNTDKFFNSFLRNTREISIGTFFHVLNNHYFNE